MACDQSTVVDWLHVIRSEYLEIPGLQLTKADFQRLWGLEPHLCDALVDALVASNFLRKTVRGLYVLASPAA
jgi:hypothetical protein